jgi:bacterial/archaeal transporter family-2 protein
MMDKNVALVVALVIGGIVAAQAPLNSHLARFTGGLPATTIALGVSCLSLAILTVLAGKTGGFANAGDAPLHVLIGGGLVGALYVGSIVWTIRALGVTGLSAATLAGQFGAALMIDHFGWLGVERSPITVSKLAGVALLAAGTYLIVSD